MSALSLGRSLLVLMGAFLLGPALAQQTVSFAGLDTDRNGGLSRTEFARLRIVELQELFADLDDNGDHYVSAEEWTAGSPDETGIPRGSRPPVGTAAPTAPSFVPHGRNVPRVVPKRENRLPEHAPLTGHGGVPGRNRTVPARLPPPPPQLPPGGMPPPY